MHDPPSQALPRTSRLWLARLRRGAYLLRLPIRRGDGLARIIKQGLAEVTHARIGRTSKFRSAAYLTAAGVLASGRLS
jgi:hypothetical protein